MKLRYIPYTKKKSLDPTRVARGEVDSEVFCVLYLSTGYWLSVWERTMHSM